MNKIITDEKVIDEIVNRGVMHIIDKKNIIKKLKSGKKLNIKLGIDATSTTLHIGHLVPIRKLKQFQDAGHNCVLLIGDYTTKIGDPSGKDKTRPVLTDKQIQDNFKDYINQISKFIDVDKLDIQYNSKWLGKLTFEDFLKLCSTFTVQRMLERDMFTNRMNKGIPIYIHEFIYPLMQGYDSVALKTDIEIGGDDQLFNVLAGRPIQEKYGQKSQDILTTPLLEGTDGYEKMGKSLNNYIGLQDSSNDVFGKAMSIPDNLIERYFLLATYSSMKEIKKYMDEIKNGKNPRDIKLILAYKITRELYNEKKAQEAQEYFINVFSKNIINKDEIKSIKVEKKEYQILNFLREIGFTESNSEGKRLVEGEAVKIDDKLIDDIQYKFIPKNDMIIQAGKKKIVKIDLQ